MSELKWKIDLWIGRVWFEHKDEIEACFKDLWVAIDTKTIIKKSLGHDVFEIMIDVWQFLNENFDVKSAIIWGVIYDIFKSSIMAIFQKFKKAKVSVRDNKSIIYNINIDNSVNVIVVPDRKEEFEHIKTIDDLILHIQKDIEKK